MSLQVDQTVVMVLGSEHRLGGMLSQDLVRQFSPSCLNLLVVGRRSNGRTILGGEPALWYGKMPYLAIRTLAIVAA